MAWSLAIVIILISMSLCARVFVHLSARGRVYTDVSEIPGCRVAVVLGAGILPNGRLSVLLTDRMGRAIELYKAGKVQKLLMSGDNRVSHYNEPQRMAEYAANHGVNPKDIVCDFAGRRTYDSIFRAKHIFGLDRIIVISQSCHVERALFLCRELGVDGYGFTADIHNNLKIRIREIPACLSAVIDAWILHPTPVLGNKEKI